MHLCSTCDGGIVVGQEVKLRSFGSSDVIGIASVLPCRMHGGHIKTTEHNLNLRFKTRPDRDRGFENRTLGGHHIFTQDKDDLAHINDHSTARCVRQ